MKKTAILILIILVAPFILYAESDGGNRAIFSRSGWVGADYVAMGKAAEVTVNDVYAIYWNPAGLGEMINKTALTPEKINEMANKGELGKISEEDLLNFTEDKKTRSFFQFGFSAALLDIDREAAFTGMAFSLFKGVCGLGVYSLASRNIPTYDISGNKTGDMNYISGVSYLSYSWVWGVTNFGISLKTLYERIDPVNYLGGAVDFGTQVEIFPFFKVGVVLQDIGIGLYPVTSGNAVVEKKYDLGSSALRIGGALSNGDGNFTVSASVVKKLKQADLEKSIGFKYNIVKEFSVMLGINDTVFSSGIGIHWKAFDLSYAFSYDKIDLGMNNIVSLTLTF